MVFKKRLVSVFRWLNLILILATFLTYLSPFIHPGKFWIPSFFGLAYPWFLLLHLGFIVFWILQRNRYFLFSLACILMGWNHFNNFVGTSFVSGKVSPEYTSIMSFNLHGLFKVWDRDKAKEEENKAKLLRFIRQAGPVDIFCVQECFYQSDVFLSANLDYKYIYRSPTAALVTFSKYPILNSGQIDFGGASNTCIWVDVEIKAKPVRIYNVHLQSTRIKPIANRVIKKGNIQEKQTWKDIRYLFGRIKHNNRLRADQALTVAKHMNKSPHPLVLCGDFNDTPQSYTYHVLSRKLQDSFRAKGRGLGTTFAGSIPALRIDYILTDPKSIVGSCRIPKSNLSDHYPVISQILLRP